MLYDTQECPGSIGKKCLLEPRHYTALQWIRIYVSFRFRCFHFALGLCYYFAMHGVGGFEFTLMKFEKKSSYVWRALLF